MVATRKTSSRTSGGFERVSVSLSDRQTSGLEKIRQKRGEASRSSLIREAIDRMIAAEEKPVAS